MSFGKIYLLSKSDIKLHAVASALEVPANDITCLEPGKTRWPQPIGVESFIFCANQRLEPHREAIAASDPSDLFVVVENYLTDDGDSSGVFLITESGLRTTWFEGINVELTWKPKRLATDLVKDSNGWVEGSQRTLGQLLAEQDPEIDSNDWFFAVFMEMSRSTQIKTSVQLAMARARIHNEVKMEEYENFPAAPCTFVDMYSLFTRQDNTKFLLQRMRKVGQLIKYDPSRLDANRVVVGIDSRGNFIGGLFATQIKMNYIPLLKKGKLPTDANRPLVSSAAYTTEYSSGDVIELQPAHFRTGETDVILVDDVVATGGSLLAAISVLNAASKRVTHIVVLNDVEKLRPEWRRKIDQMGIKVYFLL